MSAPKDHLRSGWITFCHGRDHIYEHEKEPLRASVIKLGLRKVKLL